MGQTWRQLERLAQNRDAWRKLVVVTDGTTGKDEMRCTIGSDSVYFLYLLQRNQMCA
ncbi:hypothetical protein DPMN_012771 [Dreissena polymorpha]|uniref:Uncharacterized protein n=1 Tax=Dreissena polymorpha TaxID=45954 RepID=A0A9D4N6G5_DREPO|nr:hypothetical protein DPMN_012771 [Dreissena polymorpha]